MPSDPSSRWQAVDYAFSKQSLHFDADDSANPILQQWRQRVYQHVDKFIKPNSRILELNAGTGIDAIRFAVRGHSVHATDVSKGMIARIKEKILEKGLSDKITTQQISFDQLDQVNEKYDYVFSNFGGLNCIADLNQVTRYLPPLLNKGAFITLVIMPRITPWEWAWILKGKVKEAFRRFNTKGVQAHLESEYFITYYHSLGEIKKALNSHFQFITSEGLGVLSPPPSAENFVRRLPRLSQWLMKIDELAGNYIFKRCGDHLVVTFKIKE